MPKRFIFTPYRLMVLMGSVLVLGLNIALIPTAWVDGRPVAFLLFTTAAMLFTSALTVQQARADAKREEALDRKRRDVLNEPTRLN